MPGSTYPKGKAMSNTNDQKLYYIYSRGAGWWSNTDGWGEESNATLFTESEKECFSLPISEEGETRWFLCEERDHLREICLGTAAAVFTSINSENYYQDGYLALRDRPEEDGDSYPEDFCPWSPFEHDEPDELLTRIEDEAEFFYMVFRKTLKTIEEQLESRGVNLNGLRLQDLARRETLIY